LKEKRSESGDGGEEDHKECLYSEDLNFWCSHRGTILSRRLIGTSSTLSFVDLFIYLFVFFFRFLILILSFTFVYLFWFWMG
jgi:hypothetical protein